MNKTKYNQLREEIILAVPEIRWTICPCCNKKSYKLNGYCECEGFLSNETKSREITLEDCLIASKEPLAVTNCGLLLIKTDMSANARYVSSGISWKPNIPLQDQSDETKDFLHELICNKQL